MPTGNQEFTFLFKTVDDKEIEFKAIGEIADMGEVLTPKERGMKIVFENGKAYRVTYNPRNYEEVKEHIKVEELVQEIEYLQKKVDNNKEYYQGVAHQWENKYTSYKDGIDTALKIMELMRNE